MMSIAITKTALDLLRSNVDHGLQDEAKSLGNGFFALDVDDDVFDALTIQSRKGESLSDTIKRVFEGNRQ